MKNLRRNFPMACVTAATFAITVVLILFSVSFAMVQGEEAKQEIAQEEKARGEYGLETMTVTAQKREENVQDVPISMDVFTGIQLEDAGIQDMKELTYFSPNLYSKQNINQNMVIIRGISSHNVVLNTPAGLFVDGINYPLTFMQNPDLVDIERIEILRGPQGTLYGRNTESGAINIITKQPDNELRGKVFGEYGIFDTSHGNPAVYRAGGNISGPIIKEKLFLGLAFQLEDSDGYVENVLNGDEKAAKVDHKTGQGTIRWTPTEQWDISLRLNGFKNDDGYGYLRYVDGTGQSERHTINWDGANDWIDENNGQVLQVKYEGDAFNVISITARNDVETNFRNDGEFGPLPLPDQVFKFANTILSQELRISSPKDKGPFEWLAGLYGFKDENDVTAEFFGLARDTDFENKGYAVFGQSTYTFFERLHLTAGLRYDHQESEGEQEYNLAPAPYSADLDHDEILPKVSIAFDFSNDIMAYATVAKGFLAGGYNYAFAESSEGLIFDPEFTWNYEAGLKTTWLNNKLTVNGAVFYIDIKDKQVEEWLAGFAVRSVTNAAEASSQGFELEFAAHPIQGLSLFGGFGYADAKIDKWISDEMLGGTYDYKDKRLTFSPKHTYSAGIQYRHYMGLFGRADILGVGDFYTDAKNTQKINNYEIVNLRLGFEREHFDIVLWGKNVFDKEYLTSKSVYWGGNTIVQDGAPRTIGVTITYRF